MAQHHWLTGHRFDQPARQTAYDEALDTVLALEARRHRLDAAIATQPAWAEVVARLACLRGIGTLTALGLAVEIGDWHRFTGATIGAYLGLVPSEDSSGERRRQGAITKTGTTHCPLAAGRGGLAAPPALPAARRRAASPPALPPAHTPQ